MTEKLEECVVVVWREWSEQAGELQVFRADTKNREKSRDHFYKMDEQSIITIQEELSEDFYAQAQAQNDEVQKLLEEFKDDQLQLTLELEAYERERVQLVEKKIIENQLEQINISDEEWLEVEPKQARTEEEQQEKQAEQPMKQGPM